MIGNPVRATATTAAAFVFSASLASAAVGDLDMTFGDGGVASVASLDFDYGDPIGPLVQSDGRIVVCAPALSADGSHYTAMLFGLTRDGATDPTFGTGGRIDIEDRITATSCTALLRGADDSIFVIGYKAIGPPPYQDSETAILKLHADGAPDAQFGENGIARVDYLPGAPDAATAVALQSDGSLVLGLTLFPNAFGVVRLDAHGAYDPTFGDGGRARIELSQTPNLSVAISKTVVDAHGRIVLTGSMLDSSTSLSDFVAARLLANGTPDRSFGTQGYKRIRFDERYSSVTVTSIDSAGRIVMAGSSGTLWSSGSAPNYDVALARLLDDGTPDAAFGDGGKALIPIGAQTEGRLTDVISGLIRSDGKILLAGATTVTDTYAHLALLLQIDANGRLDDGFADHGIRAFDALPNEVPNSYALTGIVPQDSNDVLVGKAINNANVYTSFVMRVEGSRDRGHSSHRRPREIIVR